MIRKLKRFYSQYKEYARVDLVMYGVLIFLILLYILVSSF